MKRIGLLTLAIAALLAASCSFGDFYDDIVGGRSSYYNANGRKYMMNIADNLVTDVLDELELALEIDRHGTPSSAHFEINGSLTTAGSAWRVKAQDDILCGMTLRCDASNSWTMTFKGEYVFEPYNYYPTEFTLTAQPIDSTTATDYPSGAEGWFVSIEGKREERGGYRCTFGTQAPRRLAYINTRGPEARGWDQMAGNLYMTVYKENQVIDACCLAFEGSPSQATFIRGL